MARKRRLQCGICKNGWYKEFLFYNDEVDFELTGCFLPRKRCFVGITKKDCKDFESYEKKLK